MVGKTSVQVCVALAVVSLLAMVPTAAGQTQIIESELRASNDPLASEGKELDRNTTTFIIFYVTFCVQPGGFSPTGGGVMVTPTATHPDYATIGTLSPIEISYPSSPAPAESCPVEREEHQAGLTIENAPYGETLSVQLDFAVETFGDEGTVAQPAAPGSLTFSAPIVQEPAPAPGEPGSGGGGGGGGPGTQDDTPAEESPAPLPMALVLTLVGFAAIRRRRA